MTPRRIVLIPARALPAQGVFGGDLAIAHYRQQLGRSHAQLFWDARQGLQPNAFAALAGTLSAGGTLHLHLPEHYPHGDPDHQRMIDFGADPSACRDHFNQRLRQLITHPPPACAATHAAPPPAFSRQAQVVVGRRGRGKSYWLGKKIAWLRSQGVMRILLVAPFRHNLDALLSAIDNADHRLCILPPDDALNRLPAADYLIIDEASAIALHQLHALLAHYPQYSMAATLDGYEGQAQQFRHKLRLPCAAQWLTFTHAYRYAADDALERIIEHAFLLHEPLTNCPEHGDRIIERINPQTLADDESLLRAVFALLRQAHYRNTPADLKRLLDLPAQQLWLMRQGAHVVGVLHVLHETPLPAALIQPVIDGTRRPQGRLLMQQLLRHSANPAYGAAPLNRIQRIAVHPCLRRQGIARALIDAAARALPDPLGVSYAQSTTLDAFWQALGFRLRTGSTTRSSTRIRIRIR